MNRWVTVFVLLLLVVPVAVAAEDQSGSMQVKESGIEIFRNSLATSNGKIGRAHV